MLFAHEPFFQSLVTLSNQVKFEISDVQASAHSTDFVKAEKRV